MNIEKILSIISTSLLPVIFTFLITFATKLLTLRKKYVRIEIENEYLKKENKLLTEKLNEVITELNKYKQNKKIEKIEKE